MLVDLVQVTTRDGVRLDGALRLPPPGAPVAPVPGAFVCVHGTGGNFYASSLFETLSDRLVRLGCAVLRVNTRGHDAIGTAVTSQGSRRLGAAYEVVDHCRHDLAAWVEWLGARMGTAVGLIGHSLGAVKSLYALAHEPNSRVACIVAVSPPRLSYAAFAASTQGEVFLETYARAERHARAGEPDALLEVKLPLPYLITAAGYLEKYGPDERYNFLRYLDRVACPVLFTFGGSEIETNMAFRGVPEELAGRALPGGAVAVELVPGADHFYSGVRDELATRVERWLSTLSR